MKNIQEIWQTVCQLQSEIKEKFFPTLVSIGVHGRARFIVSGENLDKEFDGNFQELLPENHNCIRMVVKVCGSKEEISNNNPDLMKVTNSMHWFIIEREQGSSEILVRLKRFNYEIVGKDLSEEEYEKRYTKTVDLKKVKRWNDFLELFDVQK